jgi:hypothetical protein
MGLKLISPGALAPWYTKTIAPVTGSLEAWFCFDTALERIGFNRAPGKGNAKIVGSPTVFPTHARFKGGANYLETLVAESASFTILVVGKVPGLLGGTGTPTAAPYVGNYAGQSASPLGAGGACIYHTTDTTMTGSAWRVNTDGTGTTSSQANANDAPTSWGLRVLRCDGANGTKISNLTTGVSSVQSLATPRVLSVQPLRIGGVYGTTFLGETDISHVAIYSRALSDDEIALVAAAMRKRMLRFGIVV